MPLLKEIIPNIKPTPSSFILLMYFFLKKKKKKKWRGII
jgi:hypothetical protein